MRVVKYSLLRLGVLAVAGGLLYLLGLRGYLLALVAVIVAAAASYIFFPGPRRDAALSLSERDKRRAPRADVDAEAEDAAVQEAALERQANPEQ